MRGNAENLRPFKKPLTHEEAKEFGRLGGIKSGESRRRRKAMREVLADFMGAELTEPELIDLLEANGLPATQEAAICFAAVKRAQTGDIEACRFVRDTLGEKPVTGVSVMPLSDINVDELSDYDLKHLSNEELQMLIYEYEAQDQTQ